MTYHLIFHPQAELEYTEAYQWYEAQKAGLGRHFEEQVETRLKQIATNPEAYSFSKGSFREVTIKYFPFTIVYQASKSQNDIFIIAIYHSHRNPKKKYRKL